TASSLAGRPSPDRRRGEGPSEHVCFERGLWTDGTPCRGGAMKRFAIIWAAAAGLVAAGFFLSSGSSRADVDKEMYDALSKIAKALQDGNKAQAAQLAKAYAGKVEELGDVMHGLKPRKSKGLGWGTKPGLVDPDGIEKKLDDIDQNGLKDADMK